MVAFAPPIELGLILLTPGVIDAIGAGDRDVATRRLAHEALARFIRRDWGDDLSAGDRAANDRDLVDGGRVLACYDLLAAADGHSRVRVWVVHYPRIRDGDDCREPQTTICLPSEY